MKKNIYLSLLGAIVLSGVALADPAVPAYTLTTSDNMVGNYSVWDSGLQKNVQGSDWLSNSTAQNTSANVLSTFQDAVSLQWYARTEFTTTTTYTTLYQDYQYDYWQIGLNTNSPDSTNYKNNWFDLSLTAEAGLTRYTTWANGTTGLRTSPRGFTQVITPSMGVVLDGTATSASWNISGPNAFSSLSGSLDGTQSSSFQTVAEATDGGSISSFGFQLLSDKILGNQRTYVYSHVSNQWTDDVAINAPVPEPQTYALLLAGLIFVGGAMRRRSQG